MTRKTKRVVSMVICVILALAMVLGIVLPAFADDLEDLQAQEQALQEEKETQQLLLDATEEELAEATALWETATAELMALDAQLLEVGKVIKGLEDNIAANETLLAETEAELETQRSDLKEYYAQFKGRIQMMYETNATSYLEVILSSSSIADMFSKLEYISEMVKYDNNILAEMDRVEKAIVASKETIEQTKTQLELDKAQKVIEQENLEDLLALKQIEVDNLNSNKLAVILMKQEQEAYLASLDDRIFETQVAIENEESRLAEESRLLEEQRQAAIRAEESRRQQLAEEEERRRQEAANNQSEEDGDTEEEDDDEEEYSGSGASSQPTGGDLDGSNADRALSYGWQSWPGIGSGELYWPVDCYLISSLYGPRIHPITGEYSNHGGLDIAAQ